jgi:hypothetical protein
MARRGRWVTRERWSRLTDEEKAEHAAVTRAAWSAKYPERAALVDRTRLAIEAGELHVEPCGGCGADGAKRSIPRPLNLRRPSPWHPQSPSQPMSRSR